jgi:hypothetical protein
VNCSPPCGPSPVRDHTGVIFSTLPSLGRLDPVQLTTLSSVLSVQPLVLENGALEVFAGPEPPKERIIRSRTFAENIGALSAYLAGPGPATPVNAPGILRPLPRT